MSLVEVDTLLHNFLVVGSCGTLLDLCLIQILLYHILHLDLLVVHCTEATDYTAWGYTVVVHCCIVVVHFYIVVAHCFMVVVLG
jgi:hypothetical protein